MKAKHLTLFLALGATAALAQNNSEGMESQGEERQIQTIVIRANRSLEERFNATGSRVIVDRRDIENMGADLVTDVLKQLPGVQVTGEGTGSPVISMRGMSAASTQILIDGERVSQGRRSGQLPLDQLPSDMIERIEVIRAPTAEFKGASAGTINIVLRQTAARRETSINLSNQSVWGQNGTNAFFSRTGPIEKEDKSANSRPWTYFLGGYFGERVFGADITQAKQASGTLAGANLPTQSLGESHSRIRGREGAIFSRLNGRLDNGDTLGFGMRLSGGGSNGSLVGNSAGTNALGTTSSLLSETSQTHRSFGSFRVDHGHRFKNSKIDTWVSFQRSSENLYRPHNQTDLSGGATTASNSLFTDNRDERVFMLNTKLTGTEGTNVWMIGAEHESRDLNVASQTINGLGTTDLQLNANFNRDVLWGQNDWAIDWSDKKKSTLTAGLRLDRVSMTNTYNTAPGVFTSQLNRWTSPQPSLHLRTPIDSNTQWRANLARLSKNPQFSDLINRTTPAQGINSASNPNTTGNASLRNETTLALDAGIERRLGSGAGDGGQIGGNVFLREVSDVIARRTSYDTGTAIWSSKPENLGKATVWGIELDAKTTLRALGFDSFGSDWRLSSSATLLQSRMKDPEFGGNRIPGQARYVANLNISKPQRRTGGWYGGGTLNLTGSADYVTSTSAAASGIASGGYNKGYETLDVYIGRVHPNLGFWRLSINNLTNSNRNTLRTNDLTGYSGVDNVNTSISRRIFFMIGTQFCDNFQPCAPAR